MNNATRTETWFDLKTARSERRAKILQPLWDAERVFNNLRVKRTNQHIEHSQYRIAAHTEHRKVVEQWRVENTEYLAFVDALDAQQRREQHPKQYAEEEAFEAKRAAREAQRLRREAKNPQGTLDAARKDDQKEWMQEDMREAKADAREGGEIWGDHNVGAAWVEGWLEGNWDDKAEAGFVEDFNAKWQHDHGAEWPATTVALSEPSPAKKPKVKAKQGKKKRAA